MPHLKGKLDGVSVRAPVPTGSITDLVVTVGREVTAEEIDAAYRAAAAGPLAGILQYQPDPIVSTDIKGSPYSCIYDAELTMVHGRNVEGLRVVRQRVGLQLPARRPDGQAPLR